MRIAAAVVVVLSCAVAEAGQLHVDQYGLKELKANGGAVLTGSVVATGNETVKLAVTRVYAGEMIMQGAIVERKIYQGVEWTDPHKSPLDHRLRGGVLTAGKGSAIVLVAAFGAYYEMAPLTPQVQRALDVLYGGDAQREPIAALERDLQNPDLDDLAANELERRGALSPQALVRGNPRLLANRYQAMTAAAKRAFLSAVLPLTKADRALRLRAADATLRQLSPEALTEAALLAAQLDWKNEEERRRLDDVRLALLGLDGGDLSPFAGYLAESTIRRPRHRDSDDDLEALLKRCDTKTKAELAARFLAAIYTSELAKGRDFDGFLLGTAVALAKEAPSPALWEPLAKVKPAKPRVTSQKEILLNAVVELAIALAAIDKERARNLVEPLLDPSLTLDLDVKEAYAKHIGPAPRGKPVRAILELRPGERRRLASGELVSFKKEDGAFSIAFDLPDGTGEERALDGSDWYREWWMPPYVVIVKRVGSAVNLRFVPHERDPALQPSEAYDLAKPICDRRAAKGDLDQDPRDYDGVYVYRMTGCVVRVGLRTRAILD